MTTSIVPAASAPSTLSTWTSGAMSAKGLGLGAVGAAAGYFLGHGIVPGLIGAVAGLAAGSYWQQKSAVAPASLTQGWVGGDLQNIVGLHNIVGGGTIDGRGGIRRR